MPLNYSADRHRAETVLRRVCVGTRIDGVRFGPVPQFLIAGHATSKPTTGGQVYLNLGSSWRLYASRPVAFPRGEDTIEGLSDDDAFRQLCELREAVIENVELAADAPDLVLTFEGGRVFFVNGRHEQYETWQFGVAFPQAIGVLVVACPGNEVAVWDLPESEIDASTI